MHTKWHPEIIKDNLAKIKTKNTLYFLNCYKDTEEFNSLRIIERLKEVEAEEKAKTILMGDFNHNVMTPAWLREQNLQPINYKPGEWTHVDDRTKTKTSIDYVMTSTKNFPPLDLEYVILTNHNIGSSDHKPILMAIPNI